MHKAWWSLLAVALVAPVGIAIHVLAVPPTFDGVIMEAKVLEQSNTPAREWSEGETYWRLEVVSSSGNTPSVGERVELHVSSPANGHDILRDRIGKTVVVAATYGTLVDLRTEEPVWEGYSYQDAKRGLWSDQWRAMGTFGLTALLGTFATGLTLWSVRRDGLQWEVALVAAGGVMIALAFTGPALGFFYDADDAPLALWQTFGEDGLEMSGFGWAVLVFAIGCTAAGAWRLQRNQTTAWAALGVPIGFAFVLLSAPWPANDVLSVDAARYWSMLWWLFVPLFLAVGIQLWRHAAWATLGLIAWGVWPLTHSMAFFLLNSAPLAAGVVLALDAWCKPATSLSSSQDNP